MTINNNNIFGAFTLNEARGSRLTGDWLHTDTIANYGWFGGGFPVTATVDRIDFSNDSVTASSRGSLSLARQAAAATGNSNYGWFAGGTISVPTAVRVSTVDRIDFSNDSSTASPRGPLSSARSSLAATGNSNYGWFGGGIIPATPLTLKVTTVDRIDFSNDSPSASVRGSLNTTRERLSATGNSNYGWFGGGATPAIVSTVERIDFSNDLALTSTRSPLSLVRYTLSATGNSNYGWFGGGIIPAVTATVDRIDFSNDSTTASVRGSLSFPRSSSSATGNSNYGWFGGAAGSYPIVFATVDRIDFSNDSVTASPRGGALSAARGYLAATSGVLNIRRQKAGNYGWFGGGGPTFGRVATVIRINFSNDLLTPSPRGSLSLARSFLAATGNSNYGWFVGGSIPPGFSSSTRVDRIDFSNDSSTASIRGPLSFSKYGSAAVGNSNYGWFGSGSSGISDRIDFSNDLAALLLKSNLNLSKYRLAATGNSNYGWFGGGLGGTSFTTVHRIDFSNDNATISPRGPLTSPGRHSLAATGNSNYGWFAGGSVPAAAPTARVDRIDFSNDNVVASPRGPLSLSRDSLAATGNSNYGWFGGGSVTGPTEVQTVDCINFSNDSVTASPRGGLGTPRESLAATSNTNR
jgi:hypothetical protein